MRNTFNDAHREAYYDTTPSGLRVYIAGPISGDLVGNLPAFFDAEEVLRRAGHGTFNPARADGGNCPAQAVDLAKFYANGKTWTDYMRFGISGLMRCNAIALLPNWWRSRGADLEQRIAASMGYAFVNPANGKVTNPGTNRTDRLPEEWEVPA